MHAAAKCTWEVTQQRCAGTCPALRTADLLCESRRAAVGMMTHPICRRSQQHTRTTLRLSSIGETTLCSTCAAYALCLLSTMGLHPLCTFLLHIIMCAVSWRGVLRHGAAEARRHDARGGREHAQAQQHWVFARPLALPRRYACAAALSTLGPAGTTCCQSPDRCALPGRSPSAGQVRSTHWPSCRQSLLVPRHLLFRAGSC